MSECSKSAFVCLRSLGVLDLDEPIGGVCVLVIGGGVDDVDDDGNILAKLPCKLNSIGFDICA